MAESTITKILLRRGPSTDLALNGSSGAVLSDGEPGFTTDETYRLYIGADGENRPIPAVDGSSIVYDTNHKLSLSNNITQKINTSNTGDGCGLQSGVPRAAICASKGGIYAAKNIQAGQDVISFCSSDERLKENIQIIDDPLQKLQSLKGVTFDWNEKTQSTHTGSDTGLIAQDVEQIELPGVVTTRDDGFKAIKYERLVALLVESVKQLNNQVADLESRVESLSTSKDGVQ